MNSRQRAQLRGMANSLEPIFQVGKGGVNDQLIKQVEEALEKRELIKVTVLETAPQTARETAETVSKQIGADVVQVIGRKFILYKKSSKNPTIVLVK